MGAEEVRLRLAIIAQVGNASREFSTTDVSRALAEAAGLDAGLFPATQSYPESFLIVCSTQEARDRALGASPVPMPATFLSLRPWTRLVRATSRTLYHKVKLEIDGIPEHAWDIDTAGKFLAKHAWIERLDQETACKADLSTFKLTAWSKDPLSIPASMTLCIAEPEPRVTYADDDMEWIFGNLEPYLRQKIVLEYPIAIHLRRIEDFSSRTPSPYTSSPSEDGDSGPDGNPDRSYGFRRGVGPRITGFPRRQGEEMVTMAAAPPPVLGTTSLTGGPTNSPPKSKDPGQTLLHRGRKHSCKRTFQKGIQTPRSRQQLLTLTRPL
ncbi:unnamed protein product [Urochloa humidicola]